MLLNTTRDGSTTCLLTYFMPSAMKFVVIVSKILSRLTVLTLSFSTTTNKNHFSIIVNVRFYTINLSYYSWCRNQDENKCLGKDHRANLNMESMPWRIITIRVEVK